MPEDLCSDLGEALKERLSERFLIKEVSGSDRDFCTIDLTEDGWRNRIEDKGCQIQSSSSVSMSRDTQYLFSDILVPNCSGFSKQGKEFLITPSVDLCDGFKIMQIHFHGAGSPCPCSHVHIEADFSKIQNKSHCLGKFVNWLEKLSKYTEETCK